VKVQKLMAAETAEVFGYMAEPDIFTDCKRRDFRRKHQVTYSEPEEELQRISTRFKTKQTTQAIEWLENQGICFNRVTEKKRRYPVAEKPHRHFCGLHHEF
jgi:hypothetical protein